MSLSRPFILRPVATSLLMVALLQLGAPERVWPLLEHRPDPRLRSFLIHRFQPLQTDVRSLLGRLVEEPEVSRRRKQGAGCRALHLEHAATCGDVDDRSNRGGQTRTETLFKVVVGILWPDDQPFVGAEPERAAIVLARADGIRHDWQQQTKRRCQPLHEVAIVWVGSEVDLREVWDFTYKDVAARCRGEGDKSVPIVSEGAAPNRLSYHVERFLCRRRSARSRSRRRCAH